MNVYFTAIPADIQRRTFTVRDVERMAEIGVLGRDERVELIFGELIPMSPKGARHETLKRALLENWFNIRPTTTAIMPETTLRLSPETFVEPDFVLFPSIMRTTDLEPAAILVAIEIADSSLAFDLGPKSHIYAYFGIRELWVIDAERNRIHVHLTPEDGKYNSVTALEPNEHATPTYAPVEFAIRLDDFDIESL